MANLIQILNLVAQSLITPEQGELLVIDALNYSRKLISVNDVQPRPAWLSITVEKEAMKMMKDGSKLQAVKYLMNNRNEAAIETGIYGLKWCKEYVEEIYEHLTKI